MWEQGTKYHTFRRYEVPPARRLLKEIRSLSLMCETLCFRRGLLSSRPPIGSSASSTPSFFSLRIINTLLFCITPSTDRPQFSDCLSPCPSLYLATSEPRSPALSDVCFHHLFTLFASPLYNRSVRFLTISPTITTTISSPSLHQTV